MVFLLKEKIARGAVNGTMVLTYAPASVEILGYAGLDYVIVDTEHGANDIAEVESMIRAAEVSGLTPVVRVTKNEPAYILRAMDVGARGVLVPQVNSAAEADRAVRAVKYYPRGDRGLAGIVRAARYGFQPLDRYIADTNENTLVIVQAEDIRAVDALDEILAVDGVDGVFVGPADLSHSMAMPGRFDDPEFTRTVHAIVERTVRSGKFAGMFCFDAAQARYWRGQGVRMLCVGSDTMLFAGAARALARELKAD
ncbi:HpcH/HpaI aldolase family protein [Anaeroselena agilis]|uniref:Aldolase/citrate lyase family protein n=1 Tax=Anaeroselena agilis TaxID=3063788 RepID=A0ABU3P3E5_9FIRM|nr:aldolase/citrate lyase family protein [Selenomonadales bacterium 4137-cl]